MPITAQSLKAEESRIQEVYSRRRTGDLYSRFNPAHLFMMQERERRFLRLLARYQYDHLENKKILEIGCGSGDVLRDFVKWGANPENMFGIDLLPDRVSEAQRRCPQGVWIQQGNAVSLNFPGGHFDMVVQSLVFTSVPDPKIKSQIASEMRRVLKPDGLIVWFDYHVNNPKNPDVKGVRAREIYALFSGCKVHLEHITLAPPITRFLAPYSWLLCYFLNKIPWLCTHYIGAIQKY